MNGPTKPASALKEEEMKQLTLTLLMEEGKELGQSIYQLKNPNIESVYNCTL